MSYWNCVYFLMVTMSTGGGGVGIKPCNRLLDLVGYGDIVCQTKMGRVLQLLSLLVGLVRSFYRWWPSETFLVRLSLHPFFPRSLSYLASRASGPGLIMEPKGRGASACLRAFFLACIPNPPCNQNPSMIFRSFSSRVPQLP